MAKLQKSSRHQHDTGTRKNFPATVFACITLVVLMFTSACAYSIDGKRNELDQTRSSLRSARKNLSIAKTRHHDISRQLYRTQNQIRSLKDNISYLNQKITTSKNDIFRLRRELALIKKQHAEKQASLQTRLRDIYINSDNNFIDVLAGSQSFSEFANHADYLGQICESDEQLIKTMKLEQEAIRFKQNQLDDKYKKMLSYRGRLRTKEESLNNIEEKREELLDQAKKDVNYYAQRKCELEDHTYELEKDVQRMIREYQQRNMSYRGGSYTPPKSTGSYGWPADGIVTSNYGYRIHPIFGTSRFHTGIDIGAYHGSPIRAADGGTVIYSGWCGGYGNTIMIDHGHGTVTLYGHCSSLSVGYGQSVSKGQTVARVGSTGNSTGPHLHFEVRQDGEPVSPYGFVR